MPPQPPRLLDSADEDLGFFGPSDAYSSAKTTRRAREPGPTSSGYVLSFVRWASARATPSRSAAPRLGSPSPLSDDTDTLHTSEDGQTVDDHLQPSASAALGTLRSMLRTNVATRPPASLQTRAATH